MLLVTKGEPAEASTQWAQGGVAVVRDERDPGDSVETHIDDTLVAGGGLADPVAVAMIITEGPAAVAAADRARRRSSTPGRTACCAPARAGTRRTG